MKTPKTKLTSFQDTILKPDEETKKEVSGGGAAGLRDLLESSTED